MGQIDKLMIKILCGSQDRNIKFNDLQHILNYIGFDERIKGDHHIYTKNNISEIVNLQPIGNRAKPYQVKQVRNIILKYELGGNLDV